MNETKDIELTGFDNVFKFFSSSKEESVYVVIPLDHLHEFKDHPFRVEDNADMAELVKSVKEHGVLNPGIARETSDGQYEIISGHRRRRACEIAGIKEMPFFVRDYTDEEATVIMVDSNLQREDILPSEKAWAYRMRNDALKHQGKKCDGGWAIEELEKVSNDSQRNIQNYIRLTHLIPDLLERVDAGEIRFTQAVDLSYLLKPQQALVEQLIKEDGCHISISQSHELKRLKKEDALTEDGIRDILTQKKQPKPDKIVIHAGKLRKLFPDDYSDERIIEELFKIVEKHFKAR